jgi:hypothetical protein
MELRLGMEDTSGGFWYQVFQRFPLVLVILGMYAFASASIGSLLPLPIFSNTILFSIHDPFWRYALGGLGCLLVAFGIFLQFGEGGIDPLNPKVHGIRMVAPHQDEQAEVWTTVTGKYRRKPHYRTAMLFVRWPMNGLYWPQSAVVFDRGSHEWSGQVHIGAGDQAEPAIVFIAVLGNAGTTLVNHYFRVGRETGRYTRLEELTDDILECSRVRVIIPSA